MIETHEGVKITVEQASCCPDHVLLSVVNPYHSVFVHMTWNEADEVADLLMSAAHEAYLASKKDEK